MHEITPDSAETEILLGQVRSGNPEAFEQLFARHRPELRQFIELRLDPRMRARVDASDVVQETHLEVFSRLADFLQRRPMPFRLWLRKTAYERLLKIRRHHVEVAGRTVRREVVLPDHSSFQLAQQFLAPGSTPSQHLDKREVLRCVRQALARLSEPDREILVMRNVEGLSNQEAAQILGIEPATASQRLGRALLRLRKLLVENGLMGSQS
jgi:RNA polymerase sigma-70 factor (ECF subfamily)